jgi:hypothetical protein
MMIYRTEKNKKIIDIEDKNLVFYVGEVHTNHICNIFTFNKRRNPRNEQ